MTVQLRWLESGDGHDDDPVVRTLQFRNDLFDDGLSEWKDVPVVNARIEAKEKLIARITDGRSET